MFSWIMMAVLVLSCAGSGYAQEEAFELEPIVVSAAKFPTPGKKNPRQVDILDSQEIEPFAVNNINDVLKISPIDIQSRGGADTQADISIRGSSFEQVLVLVNGLRVSDPQTGHYDLDIPVPLNEIERVEILHGPASTLYGADAFGGVINIITKKPKKFGVFAKGSYGQYNTSSLEGKLSYNFKNTAISHSIQKEKSNGQRYDTDYDVLTFFSNADFELPFMDLNALFGYQDKEYGAFDFYSPGRNFPSREWINTKLVQVKGETKNETIKFEPKLFFRRHDDKFSLDQNRPNFNLNYHTTYIYGGELASKIKLHENNSLAAATEYSVEKIKSTNIGKHSFEKYAVLLEDTLDIGKLSATIGARLDHHSKFGYFLSPSLNTAILVSEMFKIRGGISRCFRAPSFTELYYNDAANKGNPDLMPEKALSYEAGFDIYPKNNLQLGGTVFLRDEKNSIDWVKYSKTDIKWQVTNIGKMKTYGIEAYLKQDLWKDAKISLFYTYLGHLFDKDQGYISKYKLRAPTHQVNLNFIQQLPFQITATFSATYKKRPSERDYTILDAKISKNIDNFEIFFEVNNIGNSKYYDILGVPGLRRLFKAGCSVKF